MKRASALAVRLRRAEGASGPFSNIELALRDIRAGKMVVVVDDEDRENEGDFVMAAEKGSLALDGVSLTVADLTGPHAIIAIVPYTLEHTIASEYVEGGDVNLEVDILARYMERLAAARGFLGTRGVSTTETRS